MAATPRARLTAVAAVGALTLLSTSAAAIAGSGRPAGSSGPARAHAAHARKAPKPPAPSPSPTATGTPTPTATPTASPTPTATAPASGPSSTGGPLSFVTGQPQGTTVGSAGCGTNAAGEPSLHVSKAGRTVLGSEDGLGGGSELWTGSQPGGSAASACALTYSGQPNAVAGVGAAGGDIDTAVAPALDPVSSTYRIYVASLNLGSINVATSTDDGRTFRQVPVQAGVPVDDREWIAAYGPATSLLTYHDISTGNIDVLRSDSGGGPYTQIATAIPPADYKAMNNELGNIVIDHNSGTGTSSSPFAAYQSFVAPATAAGLEYNEAFLAVSTDGGHTFVDRPIGCSTGPGSLNHQFPNVSVAPDGSLLETWSDDTAVYAARSADKGATWACTGRISTGLKQAIEPWVVAGSSGADLVFYGTTDPAGPNQTWSVYLAQASGTGGFGTPVAVTTVHRGAVCEGGVSCSTGRQLLDDFAVDTDPAGYAHIAYSHDSPDLGGSGTYTGDAVQTGGTTVGAPN